MFCTNCGAKIKPGTRFCPQCGADLSAMADANEIAADEMAAGETPGDAQDLTQPMPPAHASWKPRQASDEDAGQDEQQATSPQAMAGGAVAPREVPQAPARPKAGPSIVRSDDSSSSSGTKKITLGGSDEDDAGSSSSEEHVGFKGVTRASASSTLPTDQYADYGAQNLIDGNVTTCWAEGASGLGIGESVTLSGDERQTFGRLIPSADWIKADYDQEKNASFLAAGTVVEFVELPKPVDGNSITFTIEAASPGSRYEDTSISEITVS